jgi:Ca2+-binding RTX toxin-like protein
MARVVLGSAHYNLFNFAKLRDFSEVEETDKGLSWTVASNTLRDDVTISTDGGLLRSVDGELLATGRARGFELFDPAGETILKVTGANVPLSSLTGGGRAAWERVLSGDDTVVGTKLADKLDGLAGNDLLLGGAGNDILLGGAGNDTLDGGAGIDTADFGAQSGRDASGPTGGLINLSTNSATIGAETDTLRSIENATGTAYDDVIIGSTVANVLKGGGGDDEIHGGRGADTLEGGTGHDVLHGGEQNDSLLGGEGDDYLNGGLHDDRLYGDVGSDSLYGGDGHDLLNGGTGDDVLVGGAGDDSLVGGAGDNLMRGEAGNDLFVLGTGSNYVTTGEGRDVVRVLEKLGVATVSDFDLDFDKLALDVADAKPPSVEDLIDQGRLTISGDAGHTFLQFGGATIDLLGVALADFTTDSILVV